MARDRMLAGNNSPAVATVLSVEIDKLPNSGNFFSVEIYHCRNASFLKVSEPEVQRCGESAKLTEGL